MELFIIIFYSLVFCVCKVILQSHGYPTPPIGNSLESTQESDDHCEENIIKQIGLTVAKMLVNQSDISDISAGFVQVSNIVINMPNPPIALQKTAQSNNGKLVLKSNILIPELNAIFEAKLFHLTTYNGVSMTVQKILANLTTEIDLKNRTLKNVDIESNDAQFSSNTQIILSMIPESARMSYLMEDLKLFFVKKFNDLDVILNDDNMNYCQYLI